MIDFNELSKRCYDNAVACGFDNKDFSDEHALMLVISELGEVVEADRKGLTADRELYNKRIAEGVKMEVAFKECIKDTFEDELADVAIRLLCLGGARGVKFIEREELPLFLINTNKKVTEIAFGIVKSIVGDIRMTDLWSTVDLCTGYVYAWATKLGIPIDWHIEKKLEFNRTRGVRHGNKKY
ncbi:MAG: hypothetical protein LUD72_04060 [Bacteroidales bacterium]|nr:hypothetical protein [Bacteroidales bacterium]